MKDTKWAHIAEKVIGGYVNAYVVFSSQDSDRLKGILKKNLSSNHKSPPIIVSKFRNQVSVKLFGGCLQA